MSKSTISIVKPIRICKNCIYFNKQKYNKYDLYNHYCNKLKGYVGDTEYMKKDCVRLSLKEADEMDKQ